MHPRNPHQSRYNLKSLVEGTPELKSYIRLSPAKEETIDFTDPKAVKVLNRALLKEFYGISYWDIPEGFLCPPVPGRADYIHHIADLMDGKKQCRGLDIGTGANLIYPLIGHAAFGWTFTASDINAKAIESARNIIQQNDLEKFIEVRLQPDSNSIFKNVINPDETYDFTMCNPPFHASAQDAMSGTKRKWKNLGKKISNLNFGGQSQELWCEGGEKAFIIKMIQESVLFKKNCYWFTCLVSKEENLSSLYSALEKVKAIQVKTIPMNQGQKKSRFIAWRF